MPQAPMGSEIDLNYCLFQLKGMRTDYVLLPRRPNRICQALALVQGTPNFSKKKESTWLAP